MVSSIPLAVMGGSGFYEMPGLGDVTELSVDTPYGPTSDSIRVGTLEGQQVAFLARHGRGHRLLPSELPQRANIWALKSLGVRRLLAISAVGGLQEHARPGELVLVDQFIDRTRGLRPATFFGEGAVAHVSFADPVCPSLRAAAGRAANDAGAPAHDGGTYVCIEGPAFGTRAESFLYRGWGADAVGMTALPEARLAREAELCYALVAAVTDYDSWKAHEEGVDARTVFEVMARNVEASQRLVGRLVRDLDALDLEPCACGTSLDAALVTAPDSIPEETRQRLGPILARRLGAGA